jgi:hypothetical protein
MNIIEEIIEKFSNRKGGINTKKIKMPEHKKYLDELIISTNFLPSSIDLRFRFNYIKAGYANHPKICSTCKTSIILDINSTYCSRKCSNNSAEVVEKMRSTWNNKSNSEIDEIQNRRKKTCVEIYGVDIASKLPEVIEKNKQSHIKNWGDYAMRTPEILSKRNDTCIERYGGVGMASEELFFKMKKTNIEKYSVEYFSKTNDWYEKCVKTCLEKHGETWISRVNEINIRQQKGGYSWKEFEFPSGKVVRVQGYEPLVLLDLLTRYDEEDIIVGLQNIVEIVGFFEYEYEEKTRKYYPDIYIKSENRIIEVKSIYTFNKEKEKNLLKRDSVLKKGINFNFVIL